MAGPRTLATVQATDDVGVTGFRFLYSDGTTTSNVSEDTWFQIDANGNISFTTAGENSTANNKAALDAWTVKVQAGNAAGSWSPAVTVTLTELDKEFIIVAFFDNYVPGGSDPVNGKDIFNVWVPDGSFNPDSSVAGLAAQTWTYYRNGIAIAGPTGFPIRYEDPSSPSTPPKTQGQVEWSAPTFTANDTLKIVVVKGGITYQTPVFTVP